MNSKPEVTLDGQSSAERIARLKESMIEDFVLLCHEEIPCASKLSKEGLIDSLEPFFENLELGLVSGRTHEFLAECASIGSQHGKVRAGQKCFSIEDLAVEYRVISRIIFKRLREHASLTHEVETTVTDWILRGIASAVSSYTEFREFTRKNFLDETKEKLARALEKSQAELESFFMHADEPMFMTVGRNHRFTLANEHFENLVGKRVLGEPLGKSLGDQAEELLNGLNLVYETGTHFGGVEIKIGGKSYKMYLHPRWDSHGQVKGMMGVIQIPNRPVTKPSKIFIEVRHH